MHKLIIIRPGLMYCQVRSCVRLRGENTKAVLKSLRKHFSLKIVSYWNQSIFNVWIQNLIKLHHLLSFSRLKNCFFKYDEIIMMPRFVAEVWEVWFRENILSGTIINSRTFLGKKSRKTWNKDLSNLLLILPSETSWS